MSSPVNAPSVHIPLTYGALLIGSLIATTLSGFVTIQCVLYLKLYTHTDGRTTQLSVLAIWILDLLHTIFVGVGLWHYTISNFGHTDAIETIHWSIAMTIVTTAALTIIVHLFFARRIFMLSKRNWFLTVPIVVLAFCRLGKPLCFHGSARKDISLNYSSIFAHAVSGLGGRAASASTTTGTMLHLETFTAFKAQFRWVFTLGLALSSAVDVLITVSLCLLINTNRSTSPSSLNHLVDSLMLYTLENGAITALGTILSMICWLTMSENLIFMAMHFAITKLYANSFLVVLNVRYRLRRPDGAATNEVPLPAVLFNRFRRRSVTNNGFGVYSSDRFNVHPSTTQDQTESKLRIQVHKDVEVLYENESFDSRCRDTGGIHTAPP